MAELTTGSGLIDSANDRELRIAISRYEFDILDLLHQLAMDYSGGRIVDPKQYRDALKTSYDRLESVAVGEYSYKDMKGYGELDESVSIDYEGAISRYTEFFIPEALEDLHNAYLADQIYAKDYADVLRAAYEALTSLDLSDENLEEAFGDKIEIDTSAPNCIVGFKMEGGALNRYFYNEETDSWSRNPDDATTWTDLDTARDVWSQIDKTGFRRVFVPLFQRELFESRTLTEKEVRIDESNYTDYEEWDPADIELHKSIDWKGRNYVEYPVPEDSFTATAIAFTNDGPVEKTAKFIKYIRPNPIFPPYYAPETDPFEDLAVLGPMADGHSHGTYDIHDRYESQEIYDSMFESYSDSDVSPDMISVSVDSSVDVETFEQAEYLKSEEFVDEYRDFINHKVDGRLTSYNASYDDSFLIDEDFDDEYEIKDELFIDNDEVNRMKHLFGEEDSEFDDYDDEF